MRRNPSPGKRALKIIVFEIVLIVAPRIGFRYEAGIDGLSARFSSPFDAVIGTESILYLLPPVFPLVVNRPGRDSAGIVGIEIRIKLAAAKGCADLAGAETLCSKLCHRLMSVVCIFEEPYNYLRGRPHAACCFICHKKILCASELIVCGLTGNPGLSVGHVRVVGCNRI